MAGAAHDAPIVIEPPHGPRAAVIWLHGLGADGHDFEPVVGELKLPDALEVRFVFPHAPLRAVTINAGYVMRAWYDIMGLDRDAPQDAEGIRASEDYLHTLIQHQIDAGVPAHRIVLAGFSQGGAIALYTALRYPERLAGLLVLSAYMPLSATLAAEAHPANAQLPIFMAHGDADPVVPLALATATRALLEAQDARLNFRLYSMGHSVIPQELQDIRAWLTHTLAQPNPA